MTINPKKGEEMRIFLAMVISVITLLALDINKASVDELTQLKGIGAKKAQSIVEYRKEQKCFKNIEQMLNIKGIGPAFIEKNRKTLTFSPCK
jgi:competence protein ComEA